MNIFMIHEPKSKDAYAFDKDTLHIRVKAEKGKVNTLRIVHGDPFFWGPKEDNENEWEWKHNTASKSEMIKEYETVLFDHFFISIKPEFLRTKYAFVVNEEYLFGCREIVHIGNNPQAIKNLSNYFNFPYVNEKDVFIPPSWVKDQIWYSIFPERFCNGDDSINKEGTLPWGETEKYSNNQRFGGDLKGITSKLDYIKSAGFTGIYMTPIFESDSAHKYDIIDYYAIDSNFGNKEDFRVLVFEAHKRGLKIMLDAVFNHCSFRHPWFIDVVKHQKNSKYYDCFHIIDHEKDVVSFAYDKDFYISGETYRSISKDKRLLNYRTFAFTPKMPKWNTDHPLVREYLLDVAVYWIREFDIDGWRLDVSNEVSHDFWRQFRNVVKAEKEDAYIVGENWDNSMPWLMGEQYDGVMNYEILFPLINYFGINIGEQKYTSTQFKYTVNKVLTDYPKNVLPALYNLVDSHDTTRILEICDNNLDLVKLPYLFMYTLPGAPSVYYGGEVGLSGKHDPDNRRCMPWGDKQDVSLLAFFQKLASLRNTYQAFKAVDITWLEVNDEEKYVVYQKEDLVFILNNNDKDITVPLPFDLQGKEVKELYQDKNLVLDEEISLAPYGFFILK